jgi:outer membrane autotransporter protein
MFAALGVMAVVQPTPSEAQAPPLGTTANFAVLGGSTVTNTGPTVLGGVPAQPGSLGVSPGSAITGFFAVDGGPGILTGPGASIHQNDAVAVQAQIDLTSAYNNLAGRTPTANLTGRDLGGLTLVPGVYNFSTAAQLTGSLTLNGLGNPGSIFIFNIGSTLTTASASSIRLINAAQGGNVFWRVGSSATLGTDTDFTGDILALASITLTTDADITCGAAWAQTGAVTLDTNTITSCALIPGTGGVVIGPTGVPLFTSLLPSSATNNQRAVARALDAFVAGGGELSLALLNLLNLSPSALASALTQLSGETGTGAAQAGTQAMNSFLSLVMNPFSGPNRPFADNGSNNGPPLVVKGYAPEKPAPTRGAFAGFDRGSEPRNWGVWAAGYGGQTNAGGDAFPTGSHDRSASSFGYATGLDHRLGPDVVTGFALAGGGTRFSLSDGLAGGHSDMFQAAVYGATRFNAAYLSGALAYAWHRVSTSRYVTPAGSDSLTADFSATNLGGRVEGGYRFALPDLSGLQEYGFTPYAAGQMQTYRTPSYSEAAASGSSIFALDYDARKITTIRSELGARFDWTAPISPNSILTLRGKAAWAHDNWSEPNMTAMFQSMPGPQFTVYGAFPASDLLLASAGAEVRYGNGFSLAMSFDSEFAGQSQNYGGTGRLRYVW